MESDGNWGWFTCHVCDFIAIQSIVTNSCFSSVNARSEIPLGFASLWWRLLIFGLHNNWLKVIVSHCWTALVLMILVGPFVMVDMIQTYHWESDNMDIILCLKCKLGCEQCPDKIDKYQVFQGIWWHIFKPSLARLSQGHMGSVHCPSHGRSWTQPLLYADYIIDSFSSWVMRPAPSNESY